MVDAAELLLAGDPLGALDADGDGLRDRVHRVRALVWVGRITDAAAVELGQSPFEQIGRSLVALSQGEPARARLCLLEGEPEQEEDRILHALTAAEATRAAGDPAMAMQHAGRAVQRAVDRDPRWGLVAELALTRCLAAAGDLTGALEVGRRNVAAFETQLPGTVLLAEAYDTQALLERQLARPAVAVRYHERALPLWRTLGEASNPVASCTFQLAQAIHRTGDFGEALAMMQQAFLLTHRCLGPDHLDTWTTRFELGRMEVDAGDPFAGLPRMEAAHTEVVRRLGAQHPVVRAMRRYL